MFEPKYPKGHLNKLIIGNTKNNIGICTLWSPPQHIIKNIKNDLFAIAGQLVTKNQGISAIIRNCLLHGAITDIVITGTDLTGTKQALKNLIAKGIDENHKIIETENTQIEKEIPLEAINFFRKNITIHETDNITNEFLGDLCKNQRYANENEIDFPEHEIEIPRTFPSEGILYNIREKYITDAWPEILLKVRRFGELKPSRHGEMQELHQLSVEITDEDTHNIKWNEDFTFSKEELENYYPQVCTKNPLSDVEYTYGQRIFDYLGVDQINYVIDVLKKDLSSRYAYISLWNPSIDSISHKDQPCLTALNFLVKDRDKLNMSAWIRSNDMWGAWPSNAFALRRLQENVAKNLNLKVGSLVTNSMSAHIYSNCFENADELIKKRKMNYLKKDQKGDLVIFLSENKINILHKDRGGNEIGHYEGNTAKKLMNQISLNKLIGTTSHAMDIGMELQKAEIALEKGIEYKQDQKLNFLTSGGKKGYYIMIEGGEGCGKDYQADLLADYLKQKELEIISIREPGGTKESEEIRKVLLNKDYELSPITELFLYQAARRDLNDKIIIPSIEQGKIVISKRGFPSTYAYQGFGGGLDLKIIKRESELATQGIKPDILFILDINPELGLNKEINPDRFAAKGQEYHKKVNQGYLEVAKMLPEISVVIPYQDGNPQAMHEEIRHHLKERLGI